MLSNVDLALLERARKYHAHSLGNIYDRYSTRIYNYIYRRVGDAHLAEDLTASVFTKMLEAIRSDKLWRTSFSGWLYRIARNAAYDRLKKRKPVPFAAFEDDDGGNPVTDQLADSAPLPDELFADPALAARLAAALDRLPPPHREVLILHYHVGLTFREIGDILEVPLDTVKSRHQRGLNKLKDMLDAASNQSVG